MTTYHVTDGRDARPGTLPVLHDAIDAGIFPGDTVHVAERRPAFGEWCVWRFDDDPTPFVWRRCHATDEGEEQGELTALGVVARVVRPQEARRRLTDCIPAPVVRESEDMPLFDFEIKTDDDGGRLAVGGRSFKLREVRRGRLVPFCVRRADAHRQAEREGAAWRVLLVWLTARGRIPAATGIPLARLALRREETHRDRADVWRKRVGALYGRTASGRSVFIGTAGEQTMRTGNEMEIGDARFAVFRHGKTRELIVEELDGAYRAFRIRGVRRARMLWSPSGYSLEVPANPWAGAWRHALASLRGARIDVAARRAAVEITQPVGWRSIRAACVLAAVVAITTARAFRAAAWRLVDREVTA